MAASLTYNAVTPVSRYIATVDHVAVKAQELAAFLNEVEGVRTAYPEQGDVDFFNKQIRQLATRYQVLVDEMLADAERHGLEPDADGEWITSLGFEIKEMKAVA